MIAVSLISTIISFTSAAAFSLVYPVVGFTATPVTENGAPKALAPSHSPANVPRLPMVHTSRAGGTGRLSACARSSGTMARYPALPTALLPPSGMK